MRDKSIALWLAVCLCLVLVSVPEGLAGPKKREKHVAKFPDVDLRAYSVLIIEDFTISDPKAATNPKREAKANIAAKGIPDFVAEIVGDDVFDEVIRGPEEKRPGAVVLRANITTYKPGSRAARMMMAGAGKAKLVMDVELVSAETGERLTTFPIKRTWAWGGGMGMSKGIEDIDENVATELGMYLKQCKTTI